MRLTIILAALVLAGCSADEKPDSVKVGGAEVDLDDMAEAIDDLPDCADWDGEVVTADEWTNGCLDGGSIMIAVGIGCGDVTVYHSDVAYGLPGEEATYDADGDITESQGYQDLFAEACAP